MLVGVGQDTRAPTRVPSRLPSPRLVPVDLPDRDRGGKGPQSRDPVGLQVADRTLRTAEADVATRVADTAGGPGLLTVGHKGPGEMRPGMQAVAQVVHAQLR